MSQRAWSESDYAAGLQCDLRLWLERRTLAKEGRSDSDDRPALLAHLAEVLAPAEPLAGEGLRAGPGTPLERLVQGRIGAILDAHAESGGVRVCIDALTRRGDAGPPSLRLHVLRSGRGSFEADCDRAALQLVVLREALPSTPMDSVLLEGPDPRRPLESGAVPWRSREILGEIELLAGDVPAALARARERAAGPRPDVEPSPHCRSPQLCPYRTECDARLPTGSRSHLPRLTPALFEDLRERGVCRIEDIPAEVELSPLQRRAVAAQRSGGLVCEPSLAARLRALGPPTAYLDFEYSVPVLPWLEGMRAFEPVPYQWSLHRVDAAGQVSHREFLAEPRAGDPREAFAQSLVEALSEDGAPVLIYSPSEAEILAALARAQPQRAPALEAIRSRLVDLQELLMRHAYHPELRGSFALKRVVRALVPDVGYDGLDGVADGAEAGRALRELMGDGLPEARRERLRAGLLTYCRRDTEVMIAIQRRLAQASSIQSASSSAE